MLTVLVAASDDPIALAETLAALVPAAVNGVVRRVAIIAERQPSHATVRLIEESGADLLILPGEVAARWQAALRRKPPGWTLCLEAGLVPQDDWAEAAARFIAHASPDAAAVFRVGGGFLARLAARLRRLAGLRVTASGLLTYSGATAKRVTTLSAAIEDRRPGHGATWIIPD